MKTLILKVFATGEDIDSPAWVKVELTKELLQRVEYLSALCLEHNLRSVTTYDAPAEWDLEDEVHLTHDRLEVHGLFFWFACMTKFGNYLCESGSFTLEILRALIAAEPGNTHKKNLLKYGFIFKGDHIYQDKDVEKNYEAHLDWLKQTSRYPI